MDIEKVRMLVEAVKDSKHLVVYTGAGISTAASIPDYRGPDGVYTRLAKGLPIQPCNLTQSQPTLTHMSLVRLHELGLVKHVVSQNCDGLHVRSGLARPALSEIHGNMYIEVCTECEPVHEFFRLFDVTSRTALHRHSTGRQCPVCGATLKDTIVLPGEIGRLAWPLNWTAALEHARQTDAILVLGSTLKIMRHYKALWGMSRSKARRPKVFIVNLQPTMKDRQAVFRLPAPCDDVMLQVMDALGLTIPAYDRNKDPLFSLAAHVEPPAGASLVRRCDAAHQTIHKTVASVGQLSSSKTVAADAVCQCSGSMLDQDCSKAVSIATAVEHSPGGVVVNGNNTCREEQSCPENSSTCECVSERSTERYCISDGEESPSCSQQNRLKVSVAIATASGAVPGWYGRGFKRKQRPAVRFGFRRRKSRLQQ